MDNQRAKKLSRAKGNANIVPTVSYARAKATRRISDLGWAAAICSVCVVIWAIVDPTIAHWALLPITACGILISRDAISWIHGKTDTFEPGGLIGLFGIHFFFLAPLLHVSFDYWLWGVAPPLDWRVWLGGMAILNFLGLCLYNASRHHVQRRFAQRPMQLREWRIESKRFDLFLGVSLVLTAVLQYYVYSIYGGVSGFMEAFSDWEVPFKGMGWLFSLSESFPILAAIAYAHVSRRRARKPQLIEIVVLILAIAGLRMLFGGLRGSRSNTVWTVFWAVGIVHFWLRPIGKRLVLAGLAFLVAFLYFYGFYKSLGLDGLQALESSENRVVIEERIRRPIESTLLQDLGRSDIQAFLLHQLWGPDRDYQYGFGRTYLGALALFVPRSLWPDRPPTKIKEGTDALYGQGSFQNGGRYGRPSTHVYGLAGETMLNFGPLAIPLSFVVLGALVGFMSGLRASVPSGDARWLLFPLLVSLCIQFLGMDSDNLVFYTAKNGLVPAAVVFLGSRRLQPTRSSCVADSRDSVFPHKHDDIQCPTSGGTL